MNWKSKRIQGRKIRVWRGIWGVVGGQRPEGVERGSSQNAQTVGCRHHCHCPSEKERDSAPLTR